MLLLDVDTQVDFMVPHGALYVPGADALSGALRRLVDAARAGGRVHIATADTHTPDDPEFAAYGFPPHCVRQTAGWEKIPATRQLAPLTVDAADAPIADHRELRFTKDTFDIFTNPHFEGALRQLGTTEVLVAGVATDYCVKAAVMGLRARGIAVWLVEDAIAGVTEAGAAAAIAEMRAAGARTLTTDAAVLRLAGEEARHVA